MKLLTLIQLNGKNMNIEIIQKSKKIEEIIYPEIESYIKEFALRYSVEKRMYLNEDGSPYNDTSFIIRYLLSNTILNKEIDMITISLY